MLLKSEGCHSSLPFLLGCRAAWNGTLKGSLKSELCTVLCGWGSWPQHWQISPFQSILKLLHATKKASFLNFWDIYLPRRNFNAMCTHHFLPDSWRYRDKDNSINYTLTSYPFCMNFFVILMCETSVNNLLGTTRESICAQDSRVYEWCCSSACGAQAMPAVWQDELEGRSMRGSVREAMAHSKTRFFFLSFPCFYALLILLQLFNFFNLININKAASSPPSTEFFNHFFRQWAYSQLLCQGQTAQITQPPSCISTQGFMEKVSILLCRQWKSTRLAAQPALLQCLLFWRDHCCWLLKWFYL